MRVGNSPDFGGASFYRKNCAESDVKKYSLTNHQWNLNAPFTQNAHPPRVIADLQIFLKSYNVSTFLKRDTGSIPNIQGRTTKHLHNEKLCFMSIFVSAP